MLKNLGGESPTNGANNIINNGFPFIARTTIEGVSDFLYHRWNCEAVEEKQKTAKGSKSRKSDDIETFVYRDRDGFLCIPSEHLRMAIINAAKFRQDPRSPRKSAMDLYKAGLIFLNPLASLGIKKWDYEDKRRVVVQRNSINRVRPAIKSGWKVTFDIQVILPEYITGNDLYDTITTSGKFLGIGDFRPTFGRFIISDFKIV